MLTPKYDLILAEFASNHGLSVNQFNRVYHQGKAMSLEKKVSIAVEYLKAQDAANGARPNISELSRVCQVQRSSIRKVEEELLGLGRMKSPQEIIGDRNMPEGPGAISLDDFDIFVILMLYHEEPSRTLQGYVQGLYRFTGTIVSRSTISRFFNHGFDIKGSLCKPNLIPYDKFRPHNLERAVEFLLMMSVLDRSRIKFGDEKHLKGSELFCRRTRRNVLTGEVPPIMTHPDFRNTYSIVGFCGIDARTTPLRYSISEGINDAENFAIQVELAVIFGWLLPYDVLVLDRAAIHTGGENCILEDWLWDNFRIFVLLLPARTPEWNPIELVWNILVQRLKIFSLELVNSLGKHSLVQAAQVVLNEITHTNVDGCFRKCGV